MKTNTLFKYGMLALAALSLQAQAGEVAVSPKAPVLTPEEPYVGGRGLLTIQRPSGLVINPTSGTIPQGAFTAQYCFFLPDNDSSPYMTHGAMVSFGATDWLEVGGLFTARDNDGSEDAFSGGPLLRARLLKQDDGFQPELSIGGYAFLGDVESYSTFLALFKSVKISDDGIVRSVGFHTGLRETWIEKGGKGDQMDAPVGYFGLEIELPLRLYLVGEVSTKDEDVGDDTPYGFGVQWRLGGINISAAFANPGSVSEPSFFFGIGTQLSF